MSTSLTTLRRTMVTLVLVTVAMVSAVAPSSARTATWRLEDYGQSACFSPNVHDAWYGVYIDGRWRRPIDVGASGLPAGGSYDTTYAPIPPGRSTGEYSLAYVHVMLSTLPPVGTYTASMWASDGRTRQAVPIVLDVRSRCGY